MTPRLGRLDLIAVPGLPPVRPGDDVAGLILAALATQDMPLGDGDMVVVAQKIVSKAEGRIVDLGTVTASARAQALGKVCAKDPRLVEVILSESVRVVRAVENILIVEHRLGFIHANAGVDHSNVDDSGGARVPLLPSDPDGSAGRLRNAFEEASGKTVGVLINDSMGRAWRRGTVGHAIGSAGVTAVADLRGEADLFGTALISTDVGVGDELAAAASLVMGQAGEGTPVVLIRGAGAYVGGEDTARSLLRDPDTDLFRS